MPALASGSMKMYVFVIKDVVLFEIDDFGKYRCWNIIYYIQSICQITQNFVKQHAKHGKFSITDVCFVEFYLKKSVRHITI